MVSFCRRTKTVSFISLEKKEEREKKPRQTFAEREIIFLFKQLCREEKWTFSS
jgi:hypothetical protein